MSKATPTVDLYRRQLWALPTPSPTSNPALCKTLTLPSGGSLVINNSSTIALSSDVVYQPPCTGSPVFVDGAGGVGNSTEPIHEYRDPFYASVTPLVYIVAITTVIAWFILIILLLLPGSYSGLSSKPLVRAWRRGDGIRSLFHSRSSPFPIGYRPWLQRFAALMVVIALTTVTTDTFRHAEEQYVNGYSDANKLRNQVTGSLEVRVIRVISDLFLWLAQIQTLIRLFPRRKEKLVIKWVGFVLILLDIIFSCLNSFLVDSSSYDSRPRSYRDAIPALSYLFQLALNLLYAAWVGYYAMTKRRYAFYHTLMPEICIVAFFSCLSLLIPVVFFLVDILQSDVSAWGDYFRWVGSAAASIVVWEWVERIESLEREEKKDGILGREIFEEDDMDDLSTPTLSRRHSLNYYDKEAGTRRYHGMMMMRYDKLGVTMRRLTGGGRVNSALDSERADALNHRRLPVKHRARRKKDEGKDERPPNVTIPPPVASPSDRADATSPSSTVYTIRYHPTKQTPPVPTSQTPEGEQKTRSSADDAAKEGSSDHTGDGTAGGNSQPVRSDRLQFPSLQWAANAFRRARNSPPVEVKKALSMEPEQGKKPSASTRRNLLKLVDGVGSKPDSGPSNRVPAARQPTVIPPPTRGNQPWTPDLIRQATNLDTSIQESQQPQPESTPPSQSATYDFAIKTPTTRTTTPGGNVSGSTAINTSSPSDGRRASLRDDSVLEEEEPPPPATGAGEGESSP